jgi:hypothetical protein
MIVHKSCSPRGVFRKTRRRWDGMRRPRAGLVTPHSRGLGSPSAPLRGAAFDGLDVDGMKESESSPDGGPARGPIPPEDRNRRRRSAGRRLSSDRKEERGRLASVPGGRADRSGGLASLRVSRRSAPPTWGAQIWNSGLPGAGSKNTGNGARLDAPTNSAHPRGSGGPAQSFQTERVQVCNSALGPRLRGDERRRGAASQPVGYGAWRA